MTREEREQAIAYLETSFVAESNTDGGWSTHHNNVIRTAIKALEQEPCDLLIIKSDKYLHPDDRKKLMEKIKREKESGVIILPPCFEPLLVPNDIEIRIEQEPCDDAVSRQAVIEIIDEEWLCNAEYEFRPLAEAIEQLPSVRPQPKMGHWEKTDDKYGAFFICDNCHRQSDIMENYCPNCGAKMVEPQERSNKG